MEITLNQPTKQVFTSVDMTPGVSSFTPVALLDGIVTTLSPAPTYTEIGWGLYTMNFTPSATGRLKVFIENGLQIDVDVVPKTIQNTLKDIGDEALGSWSWNKVTGVF